MCGIDQTGVTGLNLFVINIDWNDKILDVSFMSNLKNTFVVKVWMLSIPIIQNCTVILKKNGMSGPSALLSK